MLGRVAANQIITSTDINNWLDAIEAVPPKVALRMSGNQSIPNATYTALLFDVEDIDTEDGHSTSTDTSRYNVPTTGWWKCSATGSFANDVDGLRIVAYAVNGVVKSQGTEQVPTVTSGGSGTIITGATMLYLVAGDYLELQVYHTAGAALNVNGYLQALWVST